MKKSVYRNFIELVAVGSITGVFAGIVVTAFTLLAHEGEKISRGFYAYVRANPAFLPLLLLALLAGAFLLSVAVNISSVVRGCGFPQAEGATRGLVPLKWWRDLSLMFASALVSVFLGLSIGAEGPSVLIGACTGDGVSKGLKRDQMIRKYQITGGACAGLAVAANAPLTGMAFAFEEAHKRFTPEVFICAFSSVIFGVFTRAVIYALFDLENGSSFSSYILHELPAKYYIFAILAGGACGLLGVAFYKTVFKMRKLFRKINGKTPRISHGIRIAVAVLLGGLVSLLAVGVMGGGHELVQSLGSLGGSASPTTPSVFGLSLVWSLLIILILKFLVTTVNVGSGLPCGILIPIIAIGACAGGLLNELWLALGMDGRYCDLMIMLCMAAFFTAVVKAPITSIIMTCELTGSFAPLLPVIIAVSLGYMIGEMAKTDGIYEQLLEEYEEETGLKERVIREVYTLAVSPRSIADKKEVRDVLWPTGTRVKELYRGEETILPQGDTVLHSGDTLVVVCSTRDPKATLDELTHILS